MTATSVDIDTPELIVGQVVSLPVAASTHLYKGSLINLSSGYAVSATNAASRIFAGVALDGPNNNTGTTAAGTRNVSVATKGIFKFALSGVAVTDVGKIAYVSDNKTLTLTIGYCPVGKIVRYDSSGYCWVEIGDYSLVADPWDVRTYTINVGKSVLDASSYAFGISTTAATVPKSGWISQFRVCYYGSTTTCSLTVALRNGTTTLATITTGNKAGKDWLTESTTTAPTDYITKDGGFCINVITAGKITYGTVLVEIKSPK